MRTALAQALEDVEAPEVDDDGDSWLVRHETAGRRTVLVLELILPGEDGAWRTICPVSDVPHDATCIVQRSSTTVPAGPPKTVGVSGASAPALAEHDADLRAAASGRHRLPIDPRAAVLASLIGMGVLILVVLALIL